ncbi:unnamed protein product [Camellia sinensis]
MQNCIRSCMSALARSSEGVLARVKAASGKKPENDDLTLKRRLFGSSEATYGKHAFLVPCSSELRSPRFLLVRVSVRF